MGGGTAEVACGLSRAVFGNACVALRECKAREEDAAKWEVVRLYMPNVQVQPPDNRFMHYGGY